MYRYIQLFNVLGVAILASACAMQWTQARHADERIRTLDASRMNQAATIVQQQTQLHDDADDLNQLRLRLEQAGASLKQLNQALIAQASQLKEAMQKREQLSGDLDKWKAAVAQRDLALKAQNLINEKLSAERNAAIDKFNALAEQYGKATNETK